MPPTFKEVHAARPSRQVAENRERDAYLARVTHVAGVQAAALTGHPAWDAFLSHLQASLNEADAQQRDWLAKLAQGYQEADVRLAQREYWRWCARTETLKEIMALPASLARVPSEHDTMPRRTPP